jgi:transcription elongation factor Elf1
MKTPSALWQKWLEVGQILARDPTAKVACPVCGQSTIVVTDVRSATDPTRFERHMRCSNCGASNILLIDDKSSQSGSGG